MSQQKKSDIQTNSLHFYVQITNGAFFSVAETPCARKASTTPVLSFTLHKKNFNWRLSRPHKNHSLSE